MRRRRRGGGGRVECASQGACKQASKRASKQATRGKGAGVGRSTSLYHAFSCSSESLCEPFSWSLVAWPRALPLVPPRPAAGFVFASAARWTEHMHTLAEQVFHVVTIAIVVAPPLSAGEERGGEGNARSAA